MFCHQDAYRERTVAEVADSYPERDSVWHRVAPERKERLARRGIRAIVRALAAPKFGNHTVNGRSCRLARNLRGTGFDHMAL